MGPQTSTALLVERATTPSRHRPRVLIVDDEAVVREVLRDVCEAFGWTADVAEAGRPAVQAARLRRPDLILLDFHLQSEIALDVLPIFGIVSPGTPVVVMSGEHPETVTAAVLRAGGTGVVSKPVTIAEVEAMLNRHRPA